MSQNVYDDPQFFHGYSKLGRSIGGLDVAPEWPALKALIPSLKNKKAVDLGCGYGWFCRWAGENGAESVLGLDISEMMLERARSTTSASNILYERSDLEELSLPVAHFDMAYSSLALHYIKDLEGLFVKVYAALKPNSTMVFSMEHPIFTAPQTPGWTLDAQGRRAWLLSSYQVEGVRTRNWLVDGVIKQHRTVGTVLNMLIAAGFNISHVQDWSPTAEQTEADPDIGEGVDRPIFMLVAVQRL